MPIFRILKKTNLTLLMKKIKTIFKDLKVYQGKKFDDNRGFLREIFRENVIKKKLVFSIVSKSNKNVLRGLHLQTKKAQDKFITVLKGRILDVAVDVRRGSRTVSYTHLRAHET